MEVQNGVPAAAPAGVRREDDPRYIQLLQIAQMARANNPLRAREVPGRAPTENLTIPSLGDRRVRVHVYRRESGNKDPQAAAPDTALICMEGGGFIIDQFASAGPTYHRIAQKHNLIAVLNSDYAHCPENSVAEGFQDVGAVIRWALDAAGSIKAKRIILYGGSAGCLMSLGLLSRTLSTDPKIGGLTEEQADTIIAGIGICPAVSSDERTLAVWDEHPELPIGLTEGVPGMNLDQTAMQACLACGAYPDVKPDDPHVNINKLPPEDFKQKSIALVTGELDQLGVPVREWSELLRSHGVKVKELDIKGAAHGFDAGDHLGVEDEELKTQGPGGQAKLQTLQFIDTFLEELLK